MATESSNRRSPLGLQRKHSAPSHHFSCSSKNINRSELSTDDIAREECNRESNRSSSLFLQNILGSKTRWRKTSNTGLVKPKQISETCLLSAASVRASSVIPANTEIPDEIGPSGCLPSCHGTQGFQEIPSLLVGRSNFLVQNYAFRAVNSSGSVHWPHGTPFKSIKRKEHFRNCLLGRLDYRLKHRSTLQNRWQSNLRAPSKSGISNKQKEISFMPIADHNMARSRVELKFRRVPNSTQQSYEYHIQNTKDVKSGSCFQKGSGITHWRNELCISNSGTMCNQEKTVPNNIEKLAASFQGHNSSSNRSFSGRSEMVGGETPYFSLDKVQKAKTDTTGLDRCFSTGMGDAHRRWTLDGRCMASSYENQANCRARTSGNLPGIKQLSGERKCAASGSYRQYGGILDPEIKRVKKFADTYSTGTGDYQSLRRKEPDDRTCQNPRFSKCSSGFSVSRGNHARRMENRPEGLENVSRVEGALRSGPDGYPIQLSTGKVCESIQSSASNRSGCQDDRLESVEECVYIPSPSNDCVGDREIANLQGIGSSDCQNIPVPSTMPDDGTFVQRCASPSACTLSDSERTDYSGYRSQVLSMDRLSFLRYQYRRKFSADITERLLRASRDSTVKQQEVAWKAFQSWLEGCKEEVSNSSVLEFLCFLRDNKKLQTNTILNYKASLQLPLSFVPEVNLKSWEFHELSKSLYLDLPPNAKHIPEWDVGKVLHMLQDEEHYNSENLSIFSLKKCIFLVALASGNRVSELAATERSGIKFDANCSKVTMVTKPGFLFKNQRHGRAPPNISFKSLPLNPSLCPIINLKNYLKITQKTEGPVFLNTKSQAPIHPSTLSRLLAETIEEADSGKLPRGHDVRKVAASLAWTRGVPPGDIIKRMFWSSSSPFIKQYLHNRTDVQCVAANS